MRQWIIQTTLGLSVFCSLESYAAPTEKTLVKAQLTTVQHRQFCQQFSVYCLPHNSSTLYKVKQDTEQFYLVGDLKLTQIQYINGTFNKRNQWNFLSYQPQNQQAQWSVQADESTDVPELSIFPKLFPINATDYAVGIVQTWHDMYSGGGLTEEMIDFVQLKEHGQYQVVLNHIPLSMSRMIRACFSEQDYAKAEKANSSCHDEARLGSRIQYIKPNVWKIIYTFNVSYSVTSDSQEHSFTEQKSFMLYLNQNNKINFPKKWQES